MLGSPAQALKGQTVDGGWIVGERIDPPGGTGGCFSVRYQATGPNGEKAFLKALDISATLSGSRDIVDALKKLTTAYDFERELVAKCADMTRVVRGLAHGQAIVPGSTVGPVPYLIFEFAEGGDVRRHLDALGPNVDLAWKLHCLHHIATGLKQLHSAGIAHQDVKPSNVLVFPKGHKIGDLGSASEKGRTGPRDHLSFAGDPNYPPLEVFYGFNFSDWDERRLGYDLYLLGSMVCFFVTQLPMSALLLHHLDPRFYLPTWKGTFDDVLPYLQNAFALALDDLCAQVPHAEIRQEISKIMSELCNPDPRKRGIPPSHVTRSRFSLEPYVSRFDRLSKLADHEVKKTA